MGKRIIMITSALVFFLVSLSGSFDNNANFKNPQKREEGQREYTRENSMKPSGQGGYYGGHDTLTSEGTLLKKEVHKSDADGGTKFNTFANESIPNLRAGAHDEDTSLHLNRVLNDPPIGPNGWGDFFQHFYNPDSETGLKNVFNPATKKAMDYIGGVKIMLCETKKNPSDKNARERLYDYLGRIMHLLQDMATPSHTKNDIHVFTKPFENYINDHWNDIVNSDAFKNAVTPQQYLEGNYGNLPNIDNPALAPDQFMKNLANISRRYYGEEELIDQIIDPYTGALIKEVNTERLMKNVNELIPEAIKNTAGYINAIYDFMNKTGSGGTGELDFCKEPPDPPSPSNDHPDDRFDVSDEFYWEKNYGVSEIDLTDFYLRTAIKKGKIGVWYKKRFMEIFVEGRTTYKDAPQETKDAIEEEFHSIGRKLEQRINQAANDWKGAPDVALFANGFYNPSISLMLKIGEPVSFQRIDFDPAIVTDHPVLLVPTGGFYGLKNSTTVKALLDEYVKNGGTLVALTQQHGYDWDLLPVPIDPETGERKPVMGYGYQEDQSCQFNSVYINTYHPMLSVFSTSTANIGVDGYFWSYPDNSTVLLRRVSNGQPAMIMYPYGNGYVIATAMYTDFAFTHNQTNQTEIGFMQNVISWAKKPENIAEVRPGQTVNLNINVSNFVDTGAATVKFTILDPSRKTIGEWTQGISIPAGQSATVPVTYTTTQNSALGIYHIDYILYDSSGTIIQPQAETDSGRFVVSNPPSNPYKSPDFNFSVQSDAEYYIYGSPATFTFILWNNTEIERQISVAGNLSHHRVWIKKTVTVPPKGSTSFSYILDEVKDLDRCFTWFYDETGKEVGLESKGIWAIVPSASGTVTTDKYFYMRGETVTIFTSIRNDINFSWQPPAKIEVRDYEGTVVFEDLKRVVIPPLGTVSFSASFTLPQGAAVGSYNVTSYSPGIDWYSWWNMTTFEVPQSQISVSPNLPSAFNMGANTISFTLKNTGRANISSGTIDVTLKDPDGSVVFSRSLPFAIAMGERKTMDIPISISSLKIGQYILTYRQSDETKTGQPTSITLPYSCDLTLSLDKPSYKIGETANVTVSIANPGKFIQEASLTIDVPFLRLSETNSVTVNPSETKTIPYSFSLPLALKQGGPVKLTLSFPSGDQIKKEINLALKPVAINQSIVFDKDSYRIRESLGIHYTITNDGNLASPLNVSFTLSIPDLNYTYEGSLALESGQPAEVPLAIPIPETLLPGLYKVKVVLALPWEPSLTNETGFVVPESSLKLRYAGPPTPMGGDTISLSIENTGGVDTTYTTGKLFINDGQGIEIYRGSVTGGILAGEKKELINIQIPSQVLNGPAYLHAQMTDSNTGKTAYYDKAIEIKGLTASLQARTDKEAYLKTEAITGISTLSNGAYGIEGGSLKVSVMIPSITEKFTHFLPQRGWWLFRGPSGAAIGADGSVYVADTYNSRIEKFDSSGNFIMKWGDYCATDNDYDGVPDQSCGGGQFGEPHGIAIGPEGSVYVADTSNHRIQKFGSTGNFITMWGSYGSGAGQFNNPEGIAVGSDGSVLVADTRNNRVQKFDSNGNLMMMWTYVLPEWGFHRPSGIAIGPDGSVYVADTDENIILKLDSNGDFIRMWGGLCWTDTNDDRMPDQSCDGRFYYPQGIAIDSDGYIYVADTYNSRIEKFDSSGNFIAKWGKPGGGDGEFWVPAGVAVGSNGTVFVADTGNERIQKFGSSGNFILKWGEVGSGDGELAHPEGIAIGADKSIYIADSGNNRIQKFDSSGNFITKWGSYCVTDPNWDGVPENSCDGGQFAEPAGVAIGPDGSVYVADFLNHRIQKFNSSGDFISEWPDVCADAIQCRPAGIAVGPDGSVYVANHVHGIQKYDSDGNFITEWGGEGSGDGQFSWDTYSPVGIAVGRDGLVYVADAYNNRIQKFDSNGNFITKWGIDGSGDGQFSYPGGITIAPDGSVYVADTWNWRVQKFDSSGNFVKAWQSTYDTDYGDGEFFTAVGVAVAPDGTVFVLDSELNRVQKMAAGNMTETLFQTTLSINQSAGIAQDYITNIGTLNATGKFYLQADLKNSLGQAIANASYPFYIGEGNTVLLVNTDKKVYKLGETVTIAGQVENRATIEAVGLILTLNSKFNTQNSEPLFTESFNIPAGGNYPFMITATAGNEGTVTLTGIVTQDNSTLAEIADPYEVAKPNVSVSVSTADIAGSQPFNMNVEMKNTGKVGATVQFGVQSSEFRDSQAITIPAGEIKLLQYSQQITKDTSYTFTFTGDIEQTIQQEVRYGEGAEVCVDVAPLYKEGDIVIEYDLSNMGWVEVSYPFTFTLLKDGQEISKTTKTHTLPVYGDVLDSLSFNLSGGLYVLRYETEGFQAESQIQVAKAGQGQITMGVNDYYPEGIVIVPYTIKNTGPFDEEYGLQIELGTSLISETAFIPAGGEYSGDLRFDLPSGNYTIKATLASQPSIPLIRSFRVAGENNAQMAIALGSQTNGLIPVNVGLTNSGFNTIEGTVQLSIVNSAGATVWNGYQEVTLPSSSTPSLSTQIFNINPSALTAGNYTLQAKLLNNSSQQISVQSSSFGVQSPSFQITQLPPYQTFPGGQEATFAFTVKNIGNQEGSFDLRFKAYDLIDSTQRQWLKANEEKTVTFGFMLPEDLEEKDYFATYELNAQSSMLKGQIKYHLAGIGLNVNASLDKPYYMEGETAHLTINVQSPNSNPQSLFARVNYAGYEPQQTFTLDGNQVLMFDIPLPKIMGEKLFYGVYHEGGRSIYLNSVYIHKAGDVITLTTNKQVYHPGEIVSVSVSGNTIGDMTLSGPGGYSETFAFTGSITKTFSLPSSVGAGTYFINLQLITQNSSLITTVYPFDVAGIQVKVLECQNNKGKYASSDTIATSFTISSNTTTPAILKAWIVDPTGQYTSVGEQDMTLLSSESSPITYNSPLSTTVSGIHRLVYGIYGPEELLLCSGSEAFDVGNAVLLGISTDKVDYPQGNESVVMKVGVYGSIKASLELYLDGQSAGTQSISLNGFSTLDYILPSVAPGPHALKVVLTAGGLTSTKEVTFTYGSGLPDLTLRLSWDQVIWQSSINVTIAVVNQGKSPSGATTLHLYDGEISGGNLLSTFNIPILSQGQSQTLTYQLNLLGRAGTNTLSGVIDPSNTVYEFNESNNGEQITFTVPEVTLFATFEKDVYFTGETVPITSLVTNLSKDPLTGLVLSTEVKDQAEVQVFTANQNISRIEAMATASLLTSWSPDPNLPEGVYSIRQSIVGKEIHTQKSLTFIPGKDFTITTEAAVKRIELGEAVEYHLQLAPLKAFKGEISLSLIGYPQNSTAYFTPNPVTITEGQAQSILTVNPPDLAGTGSHSMKVIATGEGINHELDLSLSLTDFEMILHPTSQTLPQIEKANYTVTLNPLNGFDHGVTLEVNDIPPGMRASLSAREVVLPQNITLSLETSKWLLSGDYRIPIVAKARTVTHTLTAILTVQRNPLNVPGILTVPWLLNKPIIHTFNLSGELLSEFQVVDGGLGVNISAGDIDGDGVDEVIAATGWKLLKAGRLGVFRRDGTQVVSMETEQGYVSDLTVAVGDFDGDWIEEVVLGLYKSPLSDPLHGGGGVKVYKVIGDKFIDTGFLFHPYESEDYFGPPNLTIADVDGDGAPELITAPGPDPSAPAKIKVFKIDTSAGVGQWRLGSQIMDFIVPFNVSGFGAHVAAGDLDGDGRAEIIVGAGPDPRKKAEVVIVYHGESGYEFKRFTAYPGLLFGVNVAAMDVDGDGVSEILTGPGPDLRGKSKVRVFRRDGTLIREFQAYPDNIRFGVKVSTGRIGE